MALPKAKTDEAFVFATVHNPKCDKGKAKDYSSTARRSPFSYKRRLGVVASLLSGEKARLRVRK